MSISRKDALKKLEGLVPVLEQHLQLLANEPYSPAVSNWMSEVTNWLTQMEAMVPHVGKKTGARWQARIEAWKEQVGGRA